MPYIKLKEKELLEDIIHLMADVELYKANGNLNYVLFALCKHHTKPSYTNYKNFIGELNECIAEIRRMLLAPYEDSKIKENGDV